MRNQSFRPLAVAAMLALAILASLVETAEAEKSCPNDGISRTTSGSTGTGTTCSNALGALINQEMPKMSCPYGVGTYDLVYNNCSSNGSTYQVTGWYTYQCQTDCNTIH